MLNQRPSDSADQADSGSVSKERSGKGWTRRSVLASMGAAGVALVCSRALGEPRPELAAGAVSSLAAAGGQAPGPVSTASSGSYPQVDYVQLLREHNETAVTLYAKVTGNRSVEALIPFKGKRCAHYAFIKDTNDDFIKMQYGAVSDLDIQYMRMNALDYASKTGTWVTGFPPNDYTTQVGATFTFTFEGTGFNFQHFTDTRGGVWQLSVDGVVAASVSTHIDAVPADQKFTGNYASRPVARGLANGMHTVVGTFQGDDPGHPPSGGPGTSRGWVRNAASYSSQDDKYRTAIIYGESQTLTPVKRFDVLHSWSNKEFALNMTPANSGLPYHFLPEHVNVGTVFAVSQRVYFDDAEIVDWTPDASVRPVKSVKIVQQLLGRHPGDPSNPVAEIQCVHTVSALGVSIKARVKWLRPVTILAGYGMMFPVVGSFADKFITSFGNVYAATATDGSKTDLAENDQAVSYAYIHNASGTSGEPDTVVAMTIQDIAKTLRQGMPGQRSTGSVVWLQHRDATMQKLYPQPFEQYTAAAGETYEAGGTFFIGELPLAHQLLS
ncbi:hypothetical protein [Paenibacillus sp. HJGM_3]|uniref:hypothetical protein n=1 Tax=Paenibacillus sp. HJGM_3 TaxID=3379816 RepID=UPI003863DE92